MRVEHIVLKGLKKIYLKIFVSRTDENLNREKDSDIISQKIMSLIESEKPCMITRFGGFELGIVINYLGIQKEQKNILSYIKGNELDWWWNKSLINYLQTNAGFFPTTEQDIKKFCKLMLEDTLQVDVLASWLENEKYLKNSLLNAYLIQGLFLDPFWSSTPWTKALKGKKVLVIHPFESAIKSQYNKREFLFSNQDVLPEFEIFAIKAIQSMGGQCEFASWFDALEYMKSEIDKVDFDVCLIGAGAYGFPLAAYIKRKGKKAIHMGGSLQLLFGIRGKRWENPLYGAKELGEEGKYPALMNNKFWIYPGEENKPQNADNVEGGCYW